MKHLLLYCSMLILLLFAGCRNKEEISDKIVIQVGNISITEYEFRKNLPPDLLEKPQSKSYKKWLDDYIDDIYLLNDAYNKKYDTLSSVRKTLENSAKEMIGKVDGYLWQKQALPKLKISNNELKEAYSKREFVYYLDYILIPDTLKGKYFFDSIKMENRVDFEKLKEKCSNIENIIIRNGPYQWPFVEIFPIAEKIISMNANNVMPPVNTPNGTYVLFLMKKEKVNRVPFEREKETIYWDLYTVKAQKVIIEKQQEIFTQARVILDDQHINNLSIAFATINDSNDSTMLHFLGNDTLMKYFFKGETIVYTVNNYLDYVRHFPFLQEDYRLKENIPTCLKNIIIKEYTFNEADSLGILIGKKYLLDQKNFLNNLVLAEYLEKEFNSRISINENKLRNYYELHKAEFIAPEQVTVTFLMFDQNIDAAYSSISRVKEILRNNNFSAFSDSSMFPGLVKYLPGQKIKFNTSEYSPEIIQVMFSTEEYSISQPFIYKDNAILFFITGHEGNRIKDYNEVEAQVKYQLKKKELDSLRFKRLEELKSSNTLKINHFEKKKP